MVDANPAFVAELCSQLLDDKVSIAQRFRTLFSLRNCFGNEAREALEAAMNDPSALLAHEAAFCLGQMQDEKAVPALQRCLKNSQIHPMVRHEAAEALGAIGSPECLSLLEERAGDAAPEVAETCQLALRRIAHKQAETGEGNGRESDSRFKSVDPAPAADPNATDAELRERLLSEDLDLFDRYAAMFALRNRGTQEAVDAIVDTLTAKSALLRHEVAYVLGQLQSDRATQALADTLCNESEHPMVRHEAAEALGSIADLASVDLLKRFQTHPEPIVSQSCEVALDMLEHEQAGAFQYAIVDIKGTHENSSGQNLRTAEVC